MIAPATPLATAYPRPAPKASFNSSSFSYVLKSISFASNIPASSSNVITKSTSLRTVRLDASNFLATHGPTKTIFAFGDVILAALAVATIGVNALEISSITSGKYFFPSIDHDGQHDVSKNGSFPVATL